MAAKPTHEDKPTYSIVEYMERQDAYSRPRAEPSRSKCPNPHCEGGTLRGTNGVGCAVCNGGTDAR